MRFCRGMWCMLLNRSFGRGAGGAAGRRDAANALSNFADFLVPSRLLGGYEELNLYMD